MIISGTTSPLIAVSVLVSFHVVMIKYPEKSKLRFILADSSQLQEFEPEDALMERLSRIGILAGA